MERKRNWKGKKEEEEEEEKEKKAGATLCCILAIVDFKLPAAQSNHRALFPRALHPFLRG